jgi:protein-tyrosine phosphatase
MAEFVFKDMVEKRGLENQIFIASAATSMEEVGNPVHHGTKNKLKAYGISVEGKFAVQLKESDYEQFDYLVGMEKRNIANMHRIIGQDASKKIVGLMDFTNRPRDIADPWFTGDFDTTYEDIYEGCSAFLEYLLEKHPELR